MKRREMSEEQLQANVIQLAKLTGWAHYHTYNSQRSVPGWPDLVLCKPPQVHFIELKRDRGKLTHNQTEWLHMLKLCGLSIHVWRPDQWHDGTIEKLLNQKQGAA